MTNKRIFTLVITVFAVIGLASVAFAANNVTMSSDKPNIPYSECEQGGAITMSMDDGTTLHEGDVIALTLSNGVTVCGDIDYYLELADEGDEDLTASDTEPIIATTTGATIGIETDSGAIADGNPIVAYNGSNYDVGFWVRASDGSRFVTITMAKRNITAGSSQLNVVSADATEANGWYTATFAKAADGDQLIIKLFDQKDNVGWFFEEDDPVDAPNVYDDDIADAGDEGDNVLCIDTLTSNYTGDYVYAIPSSTPADDPYQLTFFGDYIIAQLISAVVYDIAPSCKDEICLYVAIESGVDQEGEVIPATGEFDFGNYDIGTCTDAEQDRWVSTGYCDLSVTGDADKYGNGILFSKEGDTFESGDQFRVTMTVRVGTEADEDEAVFDNVTVTSYWTSANEAANCSCAAADLTTAPTQATGVGFGWTAADDETSIKADFTVTADEEDYGAILFDLPQINLGIEEVAAGQKVYLDVEIAKLPCGSVKTVTICLAELIADCPTLAAVSVAIDGIAFIGDRELTNVLHGYLGRIPGTTIGSSLTYPYAPAINDLGFFTGLVINNMGSSDVDLTITVFDNSGGSAVYTTTLNSGLQFVDTLDNMADSLVDGTPALNRDQSAYVTVTAAAAVAE